ncbi:cytochrome c3 family protein, partial [bacterium]|nr:cytochrome c3 family protein [bacterium]
SHEARTGWPLNRFHQPLSCQKCHKQLGMEWANLSRQCESCHKDWNYGAFNHAKTVGVALDDIHNEMDCSDCHENRDFSHKPTCAACHDDGRKYPNSKPGP